MSFLSNGRDAISLLRDVTLGGLDALANFNILTYFNGVWTNAKLNSIASTITPGRLSNDNFYMNPDQGCAFFTATGRAAGTFSNTNSGLIVMPLMGARYKTIGTGTVPVGLLYDGTNGGIELKGDDENGKGFEIYFPRTYGIDEGLSHQATFKTITDVSGITSLAVGWRLAGNEQTAYTNYNDYVALVVKRNGANPAQIFAEVRVDGGSATSQNTNQTISDDTSDLVLKVTLASGGTNTIGFFVNGTNVSSVLATTFPASGDIIPFVELICHTDTVSSCLLSDWQGGLTTYF